MLLTSDKRVNALTGTATLRPDGDNTAGWPLCTNAACGGTQHYTLVAEDPSNDAGYVNTGTAGTTGETDSYTMQNPTINGTFIATTQVQVKWRANTPACQNTCDIVAVNIFINGALQTAQNQTISTTITNYTKTFNGSWAAINDLRIEFVRSRQGSGGPSSGHDDDVRIYQAYADVTYTYIKSKPLLTQKGYIWENDHTPTSQTARPSTGNEIISSTDLAWSNESNILSDDSASSCTTGTSEGELTHYLYASGFGFNIPANVTITGVEVSVKGHYSIVSGFHGVNKEGAQLVVGGSLTGTDQEAGGPMPNDVADYFSYGSSTNLWGASLSPTTVNSSDFGFGFNAIIGGSGGSVDVCVDHINMTVHYSESSSPALAAGSTSVTARKGEALRLRTQLRNTGGSLDIEKLGLFYDRNDGIWQKVQDFQEAVTGSGSGCSSSAWTCTSVDTTNAVGSSTSVAFSPSGIPYISYYDSTNSDLRFAHYVGSGGTGCASSEWTCVVVDNNFASSYSALAISPSGVPYIAYDSAATGGLTIAQYVRASGSGCSNTAWSCALVDTGTDLGDHISIAFGANGNPYISYYDTTNTSLMVAQYVGAGGTGCDIGATWTCTTVDNDNSVGTHTSLAFDPSGNPWVSYYDATNTNLKIVNYVTSGGNCDNTGGSDAWNCSTIDNIVGDVGQYTSLAFDSAGNPWVSYYNSTISTGFDLKVARYVGSSGSCTNTAWQCTTVESSGTVGQVSSIAFDPSGTAWISYQGPAFLKVARYVGSSGSGCSSSAWTCVSVSNTNVGFRTSLAFDPDGNPWVGFFDSLNENLLVARLADRAGEITAVPSYGGSASLTTSHADMTAYDNSANRDDADCITSGTWNNGKVFQAEEGSGLSIADGSSTAQCTEVAWTIDTTQAQINTTYRFVIATDDAIAQSRGKWRGPIAIESYPTLVIEDDAKHTTTQIVSKDSVIAMPNCTDTAWGCEYIDGDSDDTGQYSALAVSPSGVPYVSYYDATATSLMVAQYVGSGGSGCGGLGTGAWTCTTVDNDTDDSGRYTSIAFSPAGAPYISYDDAGSLKVAKYVGSGGSGCGASGSSAWKCISVESFIATAASSITFDKAGNAWISAYDTNNLLFNVYRVNFEDTVMSHNVDFASSGPNTSIATDNYGNVWVSYYEGTGANLKIAKFVGSDGNCDAGGAGSDMWDCTIVDGTGTVGAYNALAFDANNVPWISYYDGTNFSLKVAQYVGSGGNCDNTGGSDAWNCTTVHDNATDGYGQYASIAFSPDGVAYISYVDVSYLGIARYVGSGGSGCGTGGSSAWACSRVDAGTGVGDYSSIAFDQSGNAIVASYNPTTAALRMASHKGDLNRPVYQSSGTASSRNGRSSYGRFMLSSGKAAASSGTACSGATHFLGLCGITTEDGQYDSITVQADERPVYTMRARFDNNLSLPTFTWAGATNFAPNTSGSAGDIVIQAYRFGTTNAWENVNTNSSSSDCTSACVLSGIPSGTASEYFEADGSNYYVYFRVYQVQNASASITFKTDSLKAIQQNQQMRHGRIFNRSLLQPFLTEPR